LREQSPQTGTPVTGSGLWAEIRAIAPARVQNAPVAYAGAQLVGVDGRTIALVEDTDLVEVLDADGKRTVMPLRHADRKITAAFGKAAPDYKLVALSAAAAALFVWAVSRRPR
jgi:hypothetical protein